ncbi:protein ATP6V1FNB-like [Callorhinchus milii]|uniref:Sperm microtubule inner protein 1 C-terminal domain-containing protein n=1 Tax=Callorhinchus milii TaxID=7868 RepID=V9LDE3_CALMI|nr:protein ATP6V1FNB-like [Callorhinchus milii]
MKDLIDAHSQKCWTELINKEICTRIAWKTKYGNEQAGIQPIIHRKKYDVPKLAVLPAIPKKHGQRKYPAQKAPEKPNLLVAEMRPVTPQIRRLLYEGFSQEQTGRYQYLQERKAQDPVEKFPYPLLSSWDYGWRLDGNTTEYGIPSHGRLRIVQDTFCTRNGVFCKTSPTDAWLT